MSKFIVHLQNEDVELDEIVSALEEQDFEVVEVVPYNDEADEEEENLPFELPEEKPVEEND